MKRRGFLGGVASLPFLKKAAPQVAAEETAVLNRLNTTGLTRLHSVEGSTFRDSIAEIKQRAVKNVKKNLLKDIMRLKKKRRYWQLLEKERPAWYKEEETQSHRHISAFDSDVACLHSMSISARRIMQARRNSEARSQSEEAYLERQIKRKLWLLKNAVVPDVMGAGMFEGEPESYDDLDNDGENHL